MKTATTTETTADQENLDRAIDRPSNKIRQDGPLSLLTVLQNSGSRHTNVVLCSHASGAEWDWSIDLRKRLYGGHGDGQDEASSASRLVLNTSSGRILEQSLAEPGKKNLRELLASPALVPGNSRDEQTPYDVPKMSPPVRPVALMPTQSSGDQDRLKELQDDPTRMKNADRLACLNSGVQDDATLTKNSDPVSTLPLKGGVQDDLMRTKNTDPLAPVPLKCEVHDDETIMKNADPPAPLLLKDGVQNATILMKNADSFAPLPLKGRVQDDPTRAKNADCLVPRALKGGVRSTELAQEENVKQEQDFRSGLPFGMVIGQGPGLHGAIATIVMAVLNNKRR
jgi:hypothetical protein